MNTYSISIILLFLLLIFILLIRKEGFTDKCGPHTIVDIDDYVLPENSDRLNNLIQRGPPCLTQCLVENVPKVNWSISPDIRSQLERGFESDILQYNRENPSRIQDYCYRHNSDSMNNNDLINPCNDTCKNNCDADTRCATFNLNNGNTFCGEKSLNMMSSGSNLQLSNCKSCINKYWNNISNMWNNYQSYVLPSENCNA